MKKKKILYPLILCLVVGSLLIAIPITKADSGWDSSYDIGGSDWGGSSWDGGSSWSGGSYGDSHYYGSGGLSYSGSPIIFIVFAIIVVVILVASFKKRNAITRTMTSGSIPKKNNNYSDLDIKVIQQADPSITKDDFKQMAFNIYKDIQTAWMNFDRDTIRNLTTDELYNMYSAQLDTLELKNQQNIMKNIEYVDAKIIAAEVVEGVITIKVYMNVLCLDYVINKKTNKTVRGSDTTRLDIEYVLTFVKSKDNHKKVEKCPNCGAPVTINSSNECEYCGSTLVKDAASYVLSKKECVGQRRHN